jgi:hypothetical protein
MSGELRILASLGSPWWNSWWWLVWGHVGFIPSGVNGSAIDIYPSCMEAVECLRLQRSHILASLELPLLELSLVLKNI